MSVSFLKYSRPNCLKKSWFLGTQNPNFFYFNPVTVFLVLWVTVPSANRGEGRRRRARLSRYLLVCLSRSVPYWSEQRDATPWPYKGCKDCRRDFAFLSGVLGNSGPMDWVVCGCFWVDELWRDDYKVYNVLLEK